MKPVLIFALSFCCALSLRAQETVNRTNELPGHILEKYSVLKSDKKMRQGTYTATFKNVTVAKGSYTNGNRTGFWEFYNAKGKMVQSYNYSDARLAFADTADASGEKYFIERTNPADSVSVPVKIGGSCYGILPLTYRQELSQNVHSDSPSTQEVKYTHVFTVTDKGAIVAHKVMVNIGGNSKTYNLNDFTFEPALARFVPAMVNHKPVASKVTVVTYSVFLGAETQTF